jgi:hypothetical protein
MRQNKQHGLKFRALRLVYGHRQGIFMRGKSVACNGPEWARSISFLVAEPDLGLFPIPSPIPIGKGIEQADPDIAVKQVQSGIVACDQDRPTRIPRSCSGVDQPSQLLVECNDSSTGLANGRQHTELIKGFE